MARELSSQEGHVQSVREKVLAFAAGLGYDRVAIEEYEDQYEGSNCWTLTGKGDGEEILNLCIVGGHWYLRIKNADFPSMPLEEHVLQEVLEAILDGKCKKFINGGCYKYSIELTDGKFESIVAIDRGLGIQRLLLEKLGMKATTESVHPGWLTR